MKLIFFCLTLVFASHVFAGTNKPNLQSVTCSTSSMSIVISALSADSYVFTLFENGQVVGVPNEAIELGFQGYEDTLLMAYVWIFENKALGSIAIGVVGEENLATNPGSYTGKADVFLTSGNATINGATVDCTVVTK